jgi:hypothetical protein
MTDDGKGTSGGNHDGGDGLNTPAIALVVLISAVLAFAVIVLLIVVFNRVEGRVAFVKDTGKPYEELYELRHRQLGGLADYGLLDREKGRYAIPITRAMELTIQRRRENPLGPVGTPSEKGGTPEAGPVELPTKAVELPKGPNDGQ